MRNLKRALSLAVAAVMVIGMTVIGTGASYDDVTSADNQEAIEVLQAVGIMTGDDAGNFNPDQQVTRGEMAVMMTKVLDLNTGNYSVSAMPFTDVPDWAKSYVAAIYAEGVTGGISDTLYGTDDPITAAQAALMLMKALGYFQYPGDLADGWLLATIRQAGRIDLFDGIDAGAEEALTRSEVAQLVLNTLEATMVEPTGSQGVQIGDVTVGSTIKYEEIEKENNNVYVAISGETYATNTKYTVQLGEELFDGKLFRSVTVSDVDDYGFQGTKWSYPTNTAADTIGTYASAEVVATYTNASEVTYGDLYKLGDWVTTDFNIQLNGNDGTQMDVSAIVKGSDTDVAEFANYDGAQVNIVDQDGDGTIDAILVVYGLLGKVTDVNEATASADRSVDITVYASSSNATINNYETEDFAEDDYVIVYLDKKMSEANSANADDVLKVEAARSVTGKVTAYTGANATKTNVTSLSIAGTKYPTANNTYIMLTYPNGEPAVNSTEYVVYLNSNGYIVGVEGVAATADLSNVVYALKDTYQSVNTEGVQLSYTPVVYMDGTYEILSSEAANNFDATADNFYEVDTNSDGDLILKAVGSGKLGNNWSSVGTSGVTVGVDALKADTSFKDDTKIITLANGSTDTKAYVDNNTVYIFEKDSNTAVVTGSINKTVTATGSKVLVVKDANNEPYVAAILMPDTSYSATVASDIIYVKSNSVVGGGHDGDNRFYTYEAYNLEGDKITFNSKSASISVNGKFCSFEEDADGYYTLTALADADNAYYYTFEANNDTAIKFTKLGTALSFTKAASGTVTDIEDAEAADAVILNLVSGTGDDVDTLEELVDQTVVTGFEGAILMDDDNNIRMIVVTDTDKTA